MRQLFLRFDMVMIPPSLSREERIERLKTAATEAANRLAAWIDASPLPPADLHDVYDAHVLFCETIRRLDDLLAALRSSVPQEWQPIATAPKDDRILAFEMVDGKWATPPQAEPIPHVFIAWWWKGDALNAERWSGGFMGQPTHWMPLPAPPVEKD